METRKGQFLMPIQLDNCFRPSEAVVRTIAGETILVPIQDGAGHIFVLNEVAQHIWEGLDGSASVADVVRSVTEQFEVEPGCAEQDTLAFIGDLMADGLVELEQTR